MIRRNSCREMWHRRLWYAVCGATVLFLLAACSAPTVSPTGTPAPTVEPTITPLPTLTPVPSPRVGGLYVDASQDRGEISSLVYGTNYGPWLFVPLQMQPAAEDARLTSLRYPGGNWGDLNDIDTWNLDQTVAFAQQIGAVMNVHVRLRNGTAEKAAELVRYANIEKKYDIRYWTIGNEPNLFPDGYSIEQFNKEWREWATAMRAVDPSILLIGPEINQYIADPDNDYEQNLENWAVEFLKANGDMVDIVSFHRYPFPENVSAGPPTAEELKASSDEWDDLIPAMRALAREYAGRDLPVAVTEVNSSWAMSSGGEGTLDSHANAIWWGDALGRMIRQGAFMVEQFAIVGDFGLLGSYEPKPIYYVYPMYKRFGDILLFAASDDPDVSIFAARREDGTLTLMIVNLSASPVEKELTLDGFTPSSPAETWLFDKEHKAEQVDPTPLDATTTLSLSAESMTLLIAGQAK